MYTLRKFKGCKNETDIEQIYLGDSYVKRASTSEEFQKEGIICHIYGNWDSDTKEGITIRFDDDAFIMTMLGCTFETLNRSSYWTDEVLEKRGYTKELV